jgi:ubiquinol-cytochrome c reductase iron-sulfur subunit
MPDDEVVEERHPIRSTEDERAGAAAMFAEAGDAAGFPRRKMIWGSLTGALGLLALPTVIPLWDLWYRHKQEPPYEQMSHTPWRAGTRLLTDPTARPLRPEEIPIGSVVHVLPEVPAAPAEGEAEHEGLSLNDIAKAAVLLIRLEPDELQQDPARADWSYSGIVAYSKICTHVGCPVGLYEQTTHHLLCPCHQSTFDVTRHCAVVFGPAVRPLPQLAITVDDEGYLVAQRGFDQPVGPSFWERG